METHRPANAPDRSRRALVLLLSAALVLGATTLLPSASALVEDETCTGLVSTNCNNCTIWANGYCYIDHNPATQAV